MCGVYGRRADVGNVRNNDPNLVEPLKGGPAKTELSEPTLFDIFDQPLFGRIGICADCELAICHSSRLFCERRSDHWKQPRFPLCIRERFRVI